MGGSGAIWSPGCTALASSRRSARSSGSSIHAASSIPATRPPIDIRWRTCGSTTRSAPDPVESSFFHWPEGGPLRSGARACNGNGLCRRHEGGAMCPSYRAMLDERHSTRRSGQRPSTRDRRSAAGRRRSGDLGPGGRRRGALEVPLLQGVPARMPEQRRSLEAEGGVHGPFEERSAREPARASARTGRPAPSPGGPVPVVRPRDLRDPRRRSPARRHPRARSPETAAAARGPPGSRGGGDACPGGCPGGGDPRGLLHRGARTSGRRGCLHDPRRVRLAGGSTRPARDLLRSSPGEFGPARGGPGSRRVLGADAAAARRAGGGRTVVLDRPLGPPGGVAGAGDGRARIGHASHRVDGLQPRGLPRWTLGRTPSTPRDAIPPGSGDPPALPCEARSRGDHATHGTARHRGRDGARFGVLRARRFLRVPPRECRALAGHLRPVARRRSRRASRSSSRPEPVAGTSASTSAVRRRSAPRRCWPGPSSRSIGRSAAEAGCASRARSQAVPRLEEGSAGDAASNQARARGPTRTPPVRPRSSPGPRRPPGPPRPAAGRA